LVLLVGCWPLLKTPRHWSQSMSRAEWREHIVEAVSVVAGHTKAKDQTP
jgi:hypothetical protein